MERYSLFLLYKKENFEAYFLNACFFIVAVRSVKITPSITSEYHLLCLFLCVVIMFF